MPDSAPPDSASPDADPFLACTSSASCLQAVRRQGRCVEEPVPDGTLCGEGGMEVCVHGTCVSRGCGDGYREPGPVPVAERCDDGNTASGDLCSPGCEPVPLLVASRPDGIDEPPGPLPAVGIDGVGSVLVVWRAIIASTYYMRARRLSPDGVPIGEEPIPITQGGDSSLYAVPTVVGLDEGWLIAWTSSSADGDSPGVVYRLVGADGTLSGIRRANTTTAHDQSAPSVARLEGGFVMVWQDDSESLYTSRIRARLFDEEGAPRSAELAVWPADNRNEHPVVAVGPYGFVVAWTAWELASGSIPHVLARRFDAAGLALDETALLVSAVDETRAPLTSFGASATTLEGGDYVVAWTTRVPDYVGDVRARVLPRTGAPATAVLVAGLPGIGEQRPAVASLPGGGYALLYEHGNKEFFGDLGLEAIDGSLSETELVAARARLAMMWTGQGHGSLVRGPKGLWITWDDNSINPASDLSLVAYHLPF